MWLNWSPARSLGLSLDWSVDQFNGRNGSSFNSNEEVDTATCKAVAEKILSKSSFMNSPRGNQSFRLILGIKLLSLLNTISNRTILY